jgi:hypothetical protein
MSIFGFRSAQEPGEADQQNFGPLAALRQFRDNNPGVLGQIGAGMMVGQPGVGLGRATQLRALQAEKRRQEAMDSQERQRKDNATLRYLLGQGYSQDEAQTIVDSGLTGTLLAQKHQEKRWAQEDAKGRGLANYGFTPFLWKDKDGKIHASQLSDQGGAQELNMGEGSIILGPYDKGFDTKRGQVEGGDVGEATATYNRMTAKLPGLQQVVAELDKIADKATYTLGGKAWNEILKQGGFGSTEGAVARQEYNAKVSNVILPWLRDTFGAQFTVSEGQWLRSTLGSDDNTPQEKKAILKAFIEQKIRDVEALGGYTGQGANIPAPSGGVIDARDYFGGQ